MEIININSARWQYQLKNCVSNFSQLYDYFQIESDNSNIDIDSLSNESVKESIEQTIKKYPMRITPYYLSLIKHIGDPIWRQAIPDTAEISDPLNHGNSDILFEDPLNEEEQSPVPSIIHRYPDRVIFLVSNQCAVYCRHCMRKRKVGRYLYDKIYDKSGRNYISQGLKYIKEHKEIYDVIISGGDPLLLTTEEIDRILFEIRKIEHVQTIRIHTRVLCTLPFRITLNLASVIQKYHPIYINTHFNHPDEITEEASSACALLADSGIPLGCQTVLLKGVNDTPEIITQLMRKLIRIRVKPYYLHHPDQVAGTSHFRPSLETGLNIMKSIRGNLTGIAIPQYMIDIPKGYGKLPLLPDYIKEKGSNSIIVENYEGRICEYRF